MDIVQGIVATGVFPGRMGLDPLCRTGMFVWDSHAVGDKLLPMPHNRTPMLNPLLPVVAGHPFTSGLDPAYTARLASMAHEMCFDTGRVIFPEGDQSREFYLLVHGMVGLEICTLGTQHRIQTLHANDEFGWSAVVPGKSKVFQARALNRVDVLVFDGAQLAASFQQDPAFGLAFTMRLLGVVSERLSAAREQLLDMYTTESRRAGT